MKREALLLAVTTLLAAQGIGQQSPNPQPSVQAQSAPCTATSTPNPSGNSGTFKVPGKVHQILNKQLQKVQASTGISLADPSSDVEQTVNSKPTPCPPQAASPKNPPPTPAPTPRLPPDTTVTLHCNPMPPSTSGASGRPTTLVLPDSHDFAIPKANEFEVDNVVPDLAAKTPCYLVKVDPKSSKSFVSQ